MMAFWSETTVAWAVATDFWWSRRFSCGFGQSGLACGIATPVAFSCVAMEVTTAEGLWVLRLWAGELGGVETGVVGWFVW